LPRPAGVNTAHQRHVELNDVGLEVGQQVQARIACAEIVDRGQEAGALVFGQDAAQPLAVFNGFALGCLEEEAFDRNVVLPCGLERRTGAQLRLVDRIGQEIDR